MYVRILLVLCLISGGLLVLVASNGRDRVETDATVHFVASEHLPTRGATRISATEPEPWDAQNDSASEPVCADATPKPFVFDALLASHVLSEAKPANPHEPADVAVARGLFGVRIPGAVADGEVPEIPAVVAAPAGAVMKYDGQPFEHWTGLLLNELKAERRLEAVRAVHRFGTNGRAAEAAEALLTVLDGYSLRTWMQIFVDLSVSLEVGMQEYHDDLNNDGLLIASAIFAMYEIAPSVAEQLEGHAREDWIGLGPMVSIQVLSMTAPQRATPILFDLLREDGIQSEVAYHFLESINHAPAVVAGALALIDEQPQRRPKMLQLLKHVSFTPDIVRLILESIQTGENFSALPDTLCTSGLLEALVNDDDLQTPDISAEDFRCPELLPVLTSVFNSELRNRYARAAMKLLVQTDPNAVDTLKRMIEGRQSHDVLRSLAEEALRDLESERSDSDTAPDSDSVN